MENEIDLYYWPTPNGWKVTIALEEMGLGYNLKEVDIGKGEQFAKDFLKISPNNRIPAIVDRKGPGNNTISLFESGAILQYLARKTGLFYGSNEIEQLKIDQWIFWQVGNVGPMAGQAHHFIKYAPSLEVPQILPYAQDRYRIEVTRLYRILNDQLAKTEFIASNAFSIADMATWPWVILWEGQQQDLEESPHLSRWLDAGWQRPCLLKGQSILKEKRRNFQNDSKAKGILFNKT